MIVIIMPSSISLLIEPGVYSMIVAPRIAGAASKKENVITSSFLMPSSKPVLIVEPERDIPGIMARPWTAPMKIESNNVSFLLPWTSFVDSKIIPVANKP